MINLSFLQIIAIFLASSIGCQFGTGQQDPENEPDFFQQLGVIDSKKISESSGLIRAADPKDAYWTVNDSGNGNEVFLMASDGALLGVVTLEGVVNRDWEAMSRFDKDGKSWLVVADVGDNQSRYESCRVHVFPEPKMESGKAGKPAELSLSPRTIEFQYSDGPRDCETVVIDPLTLDVWLFEKIRQLNANQKPGVYRIKAEAWTSLIENSAPSELPASSSPKTPTEKNKAKPKKSDKPSDAKAILKVERAGDFNHLFLTDGDFSPDGKWLIIRNYTNALIFERPENRNWSESFSDLKPTMIPLPLQRQGETITFTADSKAVVTTSEFVRQPIWKIDIPAVLEHLKKSKEATK